MNPEIKAQWVSALRSGNYAQGRNALRSGDKYCCLGVLCELAVEAGVVVRRPSKTSAGYAYDNEAGYLPVNVREWSGVESSSPIVMPLDTDDVPTYLSSLNDVGRPFSEIADLIEAQL